MEQHPIPQQISSYEFKLVGEMTLKQFGKAAGGIVIALILNSTHLVFLVKYPLMLLFAGGGLALAFVPFQDRPLETWLKAFIKSIYSPTIYTYKKRASKNWMEIDMTKVEAQEKAEAERKEVEMATPIKNEDKVKEFIESLPSVKREREENLEAETENLKTDKKKEVETNPSQPAAVTLVKEEEKVDEIPINEERKANLNLKVDKLEATGKTVFGAIPMPGIPKVPNVIVGMVTDREGKIIEGAVIEIQDENGNPSRVLRTNALGQFRTSTQMANGRYLIVTEKEGFDFERTNIDLSGEIVQPIKITAKG